MDTFCMAAWTIHSCIMSTDCMFWYICSSLSFSLSFMWSWNVAVAKIRKLSSKTRHRTHRERIQKCPHKHQVPADSQPPSHTKLRHQTRVHPGTPHTMDEGLLNAKLRYGSTDLACLPRQDGGDRRPLVRSRRGLHFGRPNPKFKNA